MVQFNQSEISKSVFLTSLRVAKTEYLDTLQEMPTLNWIGKDKVVNHHLDVPFRVLDHQYGFDNGQKSSKATGSGNMIIKGDNLEALKSLLPKYEGKVKCIYIDPPYNTGNEGWVYNDNVNDPKIKKWLGEVVGKEGEDLSRHDKWLCMMYPRLKLLHKLLHENGAIFISIDDNEHSNLKLALDEIFGGSNFITTISWFKKVSPSNDAKWFSNDHEFVIVYAKYKSKWNPKRLPLNDKQRKYYKNPDNDIRGDWNSSTYTCNKTSEERPNLYYPIKNPNTGELVYPKKTAVWAYSQQICLEHLESNLLYWGKDGKSKSPRFKKFFTAHKGVVPRTIWLYDETGHTQEATQQLRRVLGNVFFSTPKPPRLIERVISLTAGKEDIILDSFAGSGTTAHAVLNLNKQDGGNRKFILVELGDYADTITAERNKRVINGYGEGKNAVEGTGGAFDFYQLGAPLFLSEDQLNEDIGVAKIREYIWYTETQIALPENTTDNPYLLGTNNDTDYYFYYERDKVTTLDLDFIASLPQKAEGYIIYADRCTLSESYMTKHNITFKKIPRDITRI